MTDAVRYGAWAVGIGAVSVGMAPAVVPWPEARAFAAGGAVAAAFLGVGFGTWLVRAHGMPGTGVLRALGAGMLARGATLIAGAIFASRHGTTSAWGFLIGFALAFTPLLALEIGWFMRRAPGGGRARETDVRS